MLSVLKTIGSWLEAIPGPTEHWATILSAWAWPTAALIIAWWLRKPLSEAAHKLAQRFEKDKVEIGNWLKISADTPLTTLDQQAVTEEPGTVEAADVRIIEALLEYAGESGEHAGRLVDWISTNAGPTLHPEDFLLEPNFADARKLAYKELIEGQANG